LRSKAGPSLTGWLLEDRGLLRLRLKKEVEVLKNLRIKKERIFGRRLTRLTGFKKPYGLLIIEPPRTQS